MVHKHPHSVLGLVILASIKIFYVYVMYVIERVSNLLHSKLQMCAPGLCYMCTMSVCVWVRVCARVCHSSLMTVNLQHMIRIFLNRNPCTDISL